MSMCLYGMLSMSEYYKIQKSLVKLLIRDH